MSQQTQGDGDGEQRVPFPALVAEGHDERQ